MSKTESALVILVPEAEPLVGAFRQRHDFLAAEGAPAHITVLYPFIDPRQIDSGVLDALTACFRAFAPIEFVLKDLRRFAAETLYLAPDPDGPFRALTIAIWRRFPNRPPYGGQWPDIVPHLSVGRFADETQLDQIAGELALATKDALPISATARDVVLIDNTTGRWAARSTFKLGA